MCKRFLIVFLAAMMSTTLAFAESETPESICTAEAKDAGIEDKEEMQSFIADCVEQVSQEMEAERRNGSEEEANR